ncbi:succinate dehydrogenase, cytochrome b556 subunit [Wolbachia endosymbiont of Dirofilaria (Dirofilaria) immitis]|uniref:succinate dehydrogenase, cytochrome b556 subunit n=1 Tax=Wolbachia endosymbiont of Dirofilaria (Dirofilaria) immitis TaxID=1812115 RepID=UPI001589EE00|nr:succinate dehydrogenase, cytochrome b556 subunit [Wolbachia endosymbiont of Dirofilaria (Dirofilaria) immitis]QKX02187.1 succinate dehydrogenase, cytochrome b556 subunit [Wolbachia endosymbiont of Dirofilaria (Dirofilaria) immitis]
MGDRPLSPHLQIYKIQVTNLFSIIHRLTGILLFLLLVMFSWYFILYVYFPKLFIVRYLNILLSTSIAKLVYLLCFMGFLYHFFNGIRHLLWDAGFNLRITDVSKSAILLTVMLLLSTVAFLLMFI